MNRTELLQRRIRLLTLLFIVGLVLSGATAIPLQWELDTTANILGLDDSMNGQGASGLGKWILKVRDAWRDSNAKYPFVAYGTDWLAFGHFVIAIAFVGALRDPVRNIWLFQFGMIACVLLVPYAFVFGGLRGIPVPWRLIDCSFGVIGFIPLWFCQRSAAELAEKRFSNEAPPAPTESNCSAVRRSAELYSAVSQSSTLPDDGKLRRLGPIRRSAEFNSAIRQIENLRYDPACHAPNKMSGTAG